MPVMFSGEAVLEEPLGAFQRQLADPETWCISPLWASCTHRECALHCSHMPANMCRWQNQRMQQL